MKTIRVAVIGLGEFGVLELNVLAHLPNVEVVALVSRSEQRARELADLYEVPHIFADTETMLATLTLDAAFVVTEDTRHLAPTLAALRAGVEVFLEKPISHDLVEARQMIDAAAALGRKLMVGHILRFDIKCAAIKEKITRGELGRVVSVFGRRNITQTLAPQYRYSNRLYTTGVHDIDLILWYFEGKKPVEVYMKTMDVLGQGEDVFWGMITMDDGSIGVIETHWLLPATTPWRGHVLLEVVGDKGTAMIDVPGTSLTFWTEHGVEIPDTSYWPSLYGATVGNLRDEIAYFIECVARDRPVKIPDPEDAYQSVRIAQALIQSAREKRPVQL